MTTLKTANQCPAVPLPTVPSNIMPQRSDDTKSTLDSMVQTFEELPTAAQVAICLAGGVVVGAAAYAIVTGGVVLVVGETLVAVGPAALEVAKNA